MDLEKPQPDLIPCLPPELALNCLLRVPLQSHHILKQVCRPWRSLLQSPLFYSARQCCGYAETHTCLIQGLQEHDHRSSVQRKTPLFGVTVYSSKQRAWERLPPIADLPHGLPFFCQCAAVGTSLVLLGGWDPLTWAVLKSVYIYSFISKTWRKGADMKTARSFFACASLQDQQKVLAMGGHDSSKNALCTAELYDVRRDEWTEVAEMGDERDECKAVVVGGGGGGKVVVVVVGGYGTETQGQFKRSVESYDVESGEWKREEKMEMPKGGALSCVVAHEGRLYAVAGRRLLVMKEEEEEGWEEAAVVPAEVSVASVAASSEGGIMVVGCGGAARRFAAFVWRGRAAGGGGRSPSWEKVNVPATFARVVQAACTVKA